MASHVQRITRTVVTRKPADIDPKVAGVWIVAAVTIVIVAVAVLAAQLLGGHIDLAAAIAPIVPVLIASAVGYVRKSSHRELVEDGVDEAAAIAAAAEPVLEAFAPQAAPIARDVVAGVQSLQTELDRD